MELSNQHCVPCEGNIPAMSEDDEDAYIQQITGWELLREGTHKIRKEFEFEDFKESMEFVNKIASIAESEGHHPDIYIFYDKVVLELYTHAVKGLFQNDFIMAAKIDEVLNMPAPKKGKNRKTK
ncbi:MAG TPA: 4a-hydroxytetrahydrobiopterin dehydratase [Candidatus Lokiarchaeia archaeon]|nr:4a-hydroxytetrahydrobiopterin dehydratase [Candidatus Lokiarchaeia archaeon]